MNDTQMGTNVTKLLGNVLRKNLEGKMLNSQAGLKSCQSWLNQQHWTYLHSNSYCLQIKETAKNKS